METVEHMVPWEEDPEGLLQDSGSGPFGTPPQAPVSQAA